MTRKSLARVLLAVALLSVVGMVATAAPTNATTSPDLGYDPKHVLVGFNGATPLSVRSAAHATVGGRIVNTLDWLNLDVVEVPAGLDAPAAIVAYQRLPAVAYADLNLKLSLTSVPNDTQFSDLWGLHNTGQAVKGSTVSPRRVDADIDGPEGWDKAYGVGKFENAGGTRVGILDTGIDRTHVDLLNKTKACAQATTAIGVVVNGSCSDDNLHGTHVAGTVAATINNTVGVAGVAPNAELAVFKALNGAGVGFLADIVAGIRWLYQTGGAKIISMSLGSTSDAASERQAIQQANAAGILLIAAAGNDGDGTKNYPAFYPEVMSVAATSQADKVATFSTCNSDVEIAAPGQDIWSTIPANAYVSISGTSMATPHVSGVAALVMSEKGFNASTTRSRMKSTAQSLTGGSNGRTACNGYKLVNLAAAL